MKTLIFIETILLLVMTSCGKDNTSTDDFITVDVTKSNYSPKKRTDSSGLYGCGIYSDGNKR